MPKKTNPISDPVEAHAFTDTAWDIPSKNDYQWDIDSELSESFPRARPFDELIVQNQGQSKACTFYSAYHVINWYNILEDRKMGEKRPQIDPWLPWAEFCRERWYSNMGYSIQWAADKAKKANKIQWRATISNQLPVEEQIIKMKQALDMGYFINTWSSNWNRAKTKLSHIYTIREDGQFVWHAWSIVSYDENWWIAINSRWPTWCEKGYFHVPRDCTDKIYNKIVPIDFDDSWAFEKIKNKSKAMNLVRALKALYEWLPAQRQEISHNFANYLRTFYGFSDNDL